MYLKKYLLVLVILTAEVLFAAPPEALLGPDTIDNYFAKIMHLYHRPYLRGGGRLGGWPLGGKKLESKVLTIGHQEVYFEKFTFPVFNNFTGQFEFFPFTLYVPLKSNASDSKPAPLTIIYPTIEGETILERHVAKMVIKHQGAALIAPVFDFPYIKKGEGLSNVNQRTMVGVHAVRTFIDFLEFVEGTSFYRDDKKSARSIDPYGIKQVGISNGSVAAIFVAAIDPRITQQALVIGIGNVPAVMATSTNKKIKAHRADQNAFYHLWDQQKYARLVRRYLKIDPVDVAGEMVKSVKTSLYLLEGDTTVPTVYQKELLTALQNHHEIEALEIETIKNEMELLRKSTKPEDIELVKEMEKAIVFGNKWMKDAQKASEANLTVFPRTMFNHVGQIVSTVFLNNKGLHDMLSTHIPCSPDARLYYKEGTSARMWDAAVEAGLSKTTVPRTCQFLLQ